MSNDVRKQKIVAAYLKFVAKHSRFPTRVDLQNAKITRDMVRGHFGTYDGLKAAAKEANPAAFENVIDSEFFSDSAFKNLKSKLQGVKRFVVTTAVGGAPVHAKFLAAIKNYCKLKDAELLIIPANYALYELDPELVMQENIVFRDIKLNDNLHISAIKIDPKQVDPCVGLDFLGHQEGALILGSPKQRLLSVPNAKNKLPRLIHATGAITYPRYTPRDGSPKRRDTMAEKQHVMGALVVEIRDRKTYHMRQIQANADGSFNDDFVKYTPTSTSFARALGVFEGDRHVMSTDPVVASVMDELCKRGKAKYRFVEDLADFISINPHAMHDTVIRAQLAGKGLVSLESEFLAIKKVLEQLMTTCEQVIIKKSNHDLFLDRYLSDGKFEDHNRLLATKLQVLAIEGKDPLKAGLEELFGLKHGGKIKFLGLDEEMKLTRLKIEAGRHGHQGSGGKRNPGLKGMFNAYGKSWSGHTHTAGIYQGAWNVPTITHLDLGYNKGAGAWSQGGGIQYEDGTRQLILVINGKYRLDD